MNENYVVYHLHSDLSNCFTNIDSITKYKEYIEYAKSLGMKALAFSEHGNVCEWYHKKEDIEKAGMKYIHAVEIYITETLNKKIRDNYHCVLIAKNYNGVKEINKLCSKSFNRKDNHYHYNPRVSFEELSTISENIILTTACLGGVLNKSDEEFKNKFIEFMCKRKDNCFLEIQHHNVEEQIKYNQYLYELSKNTGIKLIAGTDTHCLNETHLRGRKKLQEGKKIFFSDEDSWDLIFKNYYELMSAYVKQNSLPLDVISEAVENTNVMADMVEEFTLDKNTKYPHIYNSSVETFRKKINEGYRNNKYVQQRYSLQEVKKVLQEEFQVYNKTKSIDFMLLQEYIRGFERENGIQCGYGRGSVTGSFIAYLLGITGVDSVKNKLNFFRFMNPDRVSNADIDTDYSSKDREKVKYFLLHDRMNLPHIKTSEIITFNTIALKGAIKDIARAFHLPLNVAQEISNSVYLNENKEWDIAGKYKRLYKEVYEYAKIVEGTIVSVGSHPSGVLISDLDIEETIGMCSLATSDYPVSMLNMKELDALFYVKMDILGLDNIGIINDTCKMVGIERLNPDNTNLDDEKVWKDIREDTTLIFQWESDSARAYLKEFMSDKTLEIAKKHSEDFSYIKWFSFGNGLIRPGCADFRDDVAKGKMLITGFKELDNFLSKTFGYVTMQEDIMQFLVKFCGYSNAESDTVRRGIAKKYGTEKFIPEIERRFIEYSHKKYGVSEDKLKEIIKRFLQAIISASSYSFSWNHSDAYSMIGYICGYLRYYYPLEFITSAFNIFTDKQDKIIKITEYAKKKNIQIRPIQFRYSNAEYSCDKVTYSIYKGITSIKYLNSKVANSLYDMKNKHFNSFVDFLKVNPCNIKQTKILITLDFFKEFGKTKKLLKICEYYEQYFLKNQFKKYEVSHNLVDFFKKYARETKKKFKIEWNDNVINEIISTIPDEDLPVPILLKAQSEYLGYLEFANPKLKDYGFILDVNVKYSPKLTIYRLDTGETITVKVKKETFKYCPIEKNDIIKYKAKLEPKQKLINDVWVKLEDKELWLDTYSFKYRGRKE